MAGSMNPVGWFEIYVADMARAKAFYSAVLGSDFREIPVEGMEMWAFPAGPDNPGAGGTLVKHPMRQPSNQGTLVYFATDHCGDTADKAAAAGGQIFLPRTSIGPMGFIAIVGDTEGNAIGLHSMA